MYYCIDMTEQQSPHEKSTKNLSVLIEESWRLILAYFKQETLTPLKGLVRKLLFGLFASVVAGIGVVLIALGVLRVLQKQTGSTFTGNLSWLPYIIVVVVLLAFLSGAVMIVLRAVSKSGLRRNE